MKNSIIQSKRQGTSSGYLADNISRLSAYITLLFEYPEGTISLIGNAAPPTAKELYECSSVRRGSIRKMGIEANKPANDAKTRDKIAAFEYEINRTVKAAGGWGRITTEVLRYAREHKERWSELVMIAASRRWHPLKMEKEAQKTLIEAFSWHIATEAHGEKQRYRLKLLDILEDLAREKAQSERRKWEQARKRLYQCHFF